MATTKNLMNMGNMLFCPQCGTKLEQANKFCPACGASMEALSSNAMVIQPTIVETRSPYVNQNTQSTMQIDITPIEERPQYKKAMKKKSTANSLFIFTAIMGCLTIYCMATPGFWAGVGAFCWGSSTLYLFAFALKYWNRHKELLNMSNKEYKEELLKKERIKKEMIEAAGGFASGFIQGYMSNRNKY